MSALAPHLAGSEVDSGNTASGDLRCRESTRHAVHEHRTRRKFRPFEGDADHRIVANVELHRAIDASRIVEAVGTQAETAGSQIEQDALRLGAVVAAGVETQVSPADQAIQVFGRGRSSQPRQSEEGRNSE
jgi:hypothetical protein